MSFAGGLCCGYVADRLGSSRVALAIRWMLGGATMLLLSGATSHLANLVGITSAGFLVIGPQFVLNNLAVHAYDTELRATAVGTARGVGRLGAILGPFVIGIMQQTFHGPGPVFIAIGCAALTAAMAILLLAPEPRSTGFPTVPLCHG